jgi:beta-carotene hydroxylase
MRLRHRADRRTLLWAFGFFPAVMGCAYAHPHGLVWTLPFALYIGFCAGVFAHNHNHCPTFRSRTANAFFAAWVSVFYGYPIFAWIPTHNLNHHKYKNGPGDATITEATRVDENVDLVLRYLVR